MQEYDRTPSGHRASAVNAYNAPRIPECAEPLPVPEGAGHGQAELLVAGKSYLVSYSTDWAQGGRTTYQVQGVGALEVRATMGCYLCGHDHYGRPRPCRHVEVTYGRGPRNTPLEERQDLPVINRVTVVGCCTMDPTRPVPGSFTADRPRDGQRFERVPAKTAAKLGALVYALVRHWDALEESEELRAAAAHALAARRYREAVEAQERIRERIAWDRRELERAEAKASQQAALATASSYEEVARLMQSPPAPRREFTVHSVCPGGPETEPVVAMVTRSFVLSEHEDQGVCAETVSAASACEAAQMVREKHQVRHRT